MIGFGCSVVMTLMMEFQLQLSTEMDFRHKLWWCSQYWKILEPE